ncbi:DUF294 nucleotidyltransferase-like domain-containing protein [Robertmurraya sp. DFI.2.37]|uniref:DUF294 nucleotidyltransferase-like domain-containing protein n=1 Tax=Robertmurraya sp. DFI.2.37 TaxID=3031819 RepID=UPI001247C5FB|nr:DUF294 nucleotidyltransferase-like domain-containing protein [Robertmurraya sp. DFI.2.37]MDF1508180.1 DUF294 nucleotidyltransferase-like domain-containing protein [Robertmurraya sp. DFI.2.37]
MMENQNKVKQLFEAVQSHPFFQGVEVGTALSLIEDCTYREYEKERVLLRKDRHREGLILILEGTVEVYIENEINEEHEVLEIVQKGELIGFSSLADFLGVPRLPKEEVTIEVRALTSVKALHIPFIVIARRWDDPYVRDYLLTQVAVRLRDVYASLAEQIKTAQAGAEHHSYMAKVQDVMTERVIAVPSDTTIAAAAKKMHEEKTSSVLVMDHKKLRGIITERDMVSRVVAEGVALTEAVAEIMTKDPITIAKTAYYDDALSLILLKGVKHLPVIEEDEVVGIVTLSDLLRKENESVMKTIKQITEADESNIGHIKNAIYTVLDILLREKIPIQRTLDIVTKLYDRLVIRLIDLAIKKLEKKGYKAKGSFAFYQMGSSGRGEQFILTDQDHFLVYEGDEHEYYQLLGKEITLYMEKAGYARCQGLMMCSEAQWRGSIADWEERLRTWSLQSTRDNLLLAQNFFSHRFIEGNRELHRQFDNMMTHLLEKAKIFLYRLAQVEREHPISTLEQPFRALFRIERKQLDIKKSVLFPYHHSLQILVLLHGGSSGTSFEKMAMLTERGVISQSFSRDLQEAVNQVLSLYVKQRWEQVKKGEEPTSVLQFRKLSSREKKELILSLKTLKELQTLVFNHFSL